SLAGSSEQVREVSQPLRISESNRRAVVCNRPELALSAKDTVCRPSRSLRVDVWLARAVDSPRLRRLAISARRAVVLHLLQLRREAFEAESSRKSRRFFQKAHRLQAIPRSVAVEKHARIVALRISGEQLRLHSRVELQRLLEVMFRLFVANHCGSQHTEV